MAYNEQLANRVRIALEPAGGLEEKTMFGGLCFMLNEKMCVCIGADHLLCRVGSEVRAVAVEWPGCREMMNGNRLMKDFVYVDEAQVKTSKALNEWLARCLEFNKTAKPSRKKGK